MQKLTDAIERYPARVLAVFLAVHAGLWTALPTLFFLNLPLDLIEALVYGREWQLGYAKLPPLPWWMVDATYRLFGPDLFFYLLAQAAVVSALAFVWVTARPLAGNAGALTAILIVDGLLFFTFTAPKFNHDVLQLPLWALAGYAYWAALRQGRILFWLLLGLAVGIAFWAKYFVVVLALPLGLFVLLDRDARRSLTTPGPWIALVVAAVVVTPHLLWLIWNDFLPLTYVNARAVSFKESLDYLTKPTGFLLSQLGFLLPSLLIAAPFLRKVARAPGEAEAARGAADAFDRRIITLLAFGPAMTLVAMSLVFARNTVAMWGYPLWLFAGLWIVLHVRPLERVTLERIAVLWAVVFTAMAIAFVTVYAIKPRFDPRYVAVLFPGNRLGEEISRRYRALTGRSVHYVIGSMWAGGNIGHYAPERPRVLIDGRASRAPWIDLGDLRARGAVVVWVEGNPRVLPPSYRAIADEAEIQQPFTLPFRLGPQTVTVGWAVLRPRPVVAEAPLGSPP